MKMDYEEKREGLENLIDKYIPIAVNANFDYALWAASEMGLLEDLRIDDYLAKKIIAIYHMTNEIGFPEEFKL